MGQLVARMLFVENAPADRGSDGSAGSENASRGVKWLSVCLVVLLLFVSKVYSIYYEQESAGDQRILSLLCKCFRLFYVKGHPVRGTHRGLLRYQTATDRLDQSVADRLDQSNHDHCQHCQ